MMFVMRRATSLAGLTMMTALAGREAGWIVVKPEANATIEEATLLDHCREHLAKYKIPKRVIVRDHLPYSLYGKVDKKQLRAWIDEPRTGTRTGTRAGTRTETQTDPKV